MYPFSGHQALKGENLEIKENDLFFKAKNVNIFYVMLSNVL